MKIKVKSGMSEIEVDIPVVTEKDGTASVLSYYSAALYAAIDKCADKVIELEKEIKSKEQ